MCDNSISLSKRRWMRKMWFRLSNTSRKVVAGIPMTTIQKNVTPPGAAQAKSKGVQQTTKRHGERQRQAHKQDEGQIRRRSHAQRPDEELWQRKAEHMQGSMLWKKERKDGKWRPDQKGNRKVKKLRRPSDLVVRQSHGGSNDARLAIAFRLPECQASHPPLQPCDPLC